MLTKKFQNRSKRCQHLLEDIVGEKLNFVNIRRRQHKAQGVYNKMKLNYWVYGMLKLISHVFRTNMKFSQSA